MVRNKESQTDGSVLHTGIQRGSGPLLDPTRNVCTERSGSIIVAGSSLPERPWSWLGLTDTQGQPCLPGWAVDISVLVVRLLDFVRLSTRRHFER
jgi:hypothetical protein